MNALPKTQTSETSVPVGPRPAPAPGPIAQSVAIGFRSVYIAAFLLALVWLASNVREIASDSQAVVRRFGRIVRTQPAGLLIAWPRPIEQVQLLPGPERQLSQDVPALQPPTDKTAALIGTATDNGAAGATPELYLTGDGNAVLLSATLIYRISDPIAYSLSRSHVPAALDRLFRASAVQVAAGHDLNDFLVVPNLQQETASLGSDQQAGGDTAAAATAAATSAATVATGAANNLEQVRAEVRNSLLQTVNARLQTLATADASLGVEVERIDFTASLPPEAKSAFDQVLEAAQAADRGVAMAATDAEHRRQGATALREQLVSSAQAAARELVSNATVNTSAILPLEREETPLTRSSLLMNLYRTDVSDIMDHAGTVTLVDPKSGARFLMPGKQK
jgi:regulator of protease activity HflC (stomatin/prohibitin superfamily)